MRAAISEALGESDLLLLCGGISMGKKDYVRTVLEEKLGAPAFHGVSQRPGKPLAFWNQTEQCPPVFALPGNPNSTLVTFYRYVLPALRYLSGAELKIPLELALQTEVARNQNLTQFLPATLEPSARISLKKPQNSGDFARFLGATGLAEVAPGSGAAYSAFYYPFS